jgi:hypothetical protein
MSPFLPPTVQSRPFTIPIKRYAIWALIHLVQLLQVIVFDCARSLDIEKSKGDLVLGVWFRKEVLKGAPVENIELARVPLVCNSK